MSFIFIVRFQRTGRAPRDISRPAPRPPLLNFFRVIEQGFCALRPTCRLGFKRKPRENENVRFLASRETGDAGCCARLPARFYLHVALGNSVIVVGIRASKRVRASQKRVK